MSESKWKQIVGKSISEGAYVSPEGLRQDYAKVTPETCFSTPTQLMELQKRQEVSETITSKMVAKEPLTEEDYANIERYHLKLAKRATRRTEHNGGHIDCAFEQIAETQLLGYLQAGWQVVHKLSDGQIIVKR